MVIEWLKFRVTPELREEFIEQEDLIWTKLLEKYPGFLGKEIWLNPEVPEEVIVVIHWQTITQWKAIPQDVINETDERFQKVLGDNYKLVESSGYQVRKFPAR